MSALWITVTIIAAAFWGGVGYIIGWYRGWTAARTPVTQGGSNGVES